MDSDDPVLIYYDAPQSPTTGLFPRPLPPPPPALPPVPPRPFPDENPNFSLQPIPEDGYLWEKDGDSIYLYSTESYRSRHRCREFNCLATKRVDRDLEGEVKEVVYQGYHNHPAPRKDAPLSPSMAEETKFREISGEEKTGKEEDKLSLRKAEKSKSVIKASEEVSSKSSQLKRKLSGSPSAINSYPEGDLAPSMAATDPKFCQETPVHASLRFKGSRSGERNGSARHR